MTRDDIATYTLGALVQAHPTQTDHDLVNHAIALADLMLACLEATANAFEQAAAKSNEPA
jgi:hypothetical protein